MKNKTMIAAVCAALAWAVGSSADAAPVGPDDAAYAVDAWVVRGGTLGARLGGVVRVDAHMPANGAKFYAVKTSGGGTVFTSADTEDEPIMAFTSAKDDFSKIDEKSPLWALLARERSAARPALMTAAKSATNGQSAAATKWTELIAEGKARAAAAANGVVFPAKAGSGGTASGLSAVGDVRVAPLLPTKWYQLGDGAGAPCYNYYTPNEYCCGCVATAMSQIMRKHRFPSASVTPVTKECFVDDVAANHTMKGGSYNWNVMPLEPNEKACTEAEREAIGRLTYDAGVSVCMDWSYESGAMSCLIGDAFRKVFGYGQAVYYRVDQGLGDGEGLQKAVYSNLDAGYPVMFGICYSNGRGDKSNGHSIVGDGYGYNNGSAYMHLNMGWAGQDDLWYAMPEINTSNGSFNWIEDITYDIFPQATATTAAFSGRALLPNGKPATGATVKVYRANDDLLVTNLSVNAAGVWGTLIEAGTYNVDVELPAYGFMGAVSNVSVSAANAYPTSYLCAIDYAGSVTRTYDCTRYVSYEGNLGNSWGNDITVSGKLSGTTLEWTEPQLLEATQFADFQHAFSVSGGDAPYSWSVETTYSSTRGEGSSFDGASGTALFTYQDFDAGGASVTLPFAVPVRGKLCDRIVADIGGSIRIGDLRVRIENIWGEANQFYVANSERAVTLRWGDSASMTFTDDGLIRVAFSESFGDDYYLPASRVVVEDCNTAETFGEFVPAEEGETNADVIFAPRALPPGLALDAATGVLSGRAELDGEASFTVTVLDVGGQTLSRDFTLTVSPSANTKPVIIGCEPSAEEYVDVVSGEEKAFYVFAQDDETPQSELVYTWEVDGEEVGSFTGANGISYPFELDPGNPVATRRHTVVCSVSDGVWTRQVKQVWNVRVIKVNYVDASAEEDWEVMDGSPEHPWTQISYAAGYASAGDIVYVRPGTYEQFGGENCEIKVIAIGGPSVTFVDAEGNGPCYSCYGGAYDEELGMEIPGRKPWIEGFTLMNGFQSYGQAAGANGGTLVNCVIKDCSAARAYEWSSACIGGAFGSKLVNCVIANCSGEDCGGAFNCDLYNCNVIGNRSSNGPAGIDSRSAAYNTVFGNSFGEDVENGAVTENCLTGRDPLFVDPVNGDFRLCAGSPCLDAGDNAWLVEGVTNDLAGATRVQNGIVDIGAYEGAVGDLPAASPSVAVGEVTSGVPWSTVTVNYTLGGMDAATDYKVAFDVTANGVTRGVTNAAAKLTDGPASKVIDTAALFGAANADPRAKVRVSLIAVKTQADGVQLWEDGPYWAECNVGATKPEEYGYYFWWGDTIGYTWNGSTWVSVQDGNAISFVNASPENTLSGKDVSDCLDDGNLKSDYDAATAHLGVPWRMPTYEEFTKLVDKNVCTVTWTKNWNGTGTNGYVVTGRTAGYTDKSIFLPAAGGGSEASYSGSNLDGRYWSSSPNTYSYVEAFNLDFKYNSFYVYGNYKRYYGFTVRPVRGVAEVPSDEKEFALTAFRDLPANPTDEDIRAAIEASGAKNANRILAVIQGADDPVAAYAEFQTWAAARGELAVTDSFHAGDSFALGAEKVFENEPKVEVTSAKVSGSGTMEIAVTVKDGEAAVAVSSEKVEKMFEATSDLTDWNSAETKLEPHVTDKTQGVAFPVTFEVTPGDGTSDKAFLRIRKE